jgi:hypothetical protein
MEIIIFITYLIGVTEYFFYRLDQLRVCLVHLWIPENLILAVSCEKAAVS